MTRALNAENPATVRRELQTRYDDYRAKRRLRIGLSIPCVNILNMGATLDERNDALERWSDRYSSKSKLLMRNVAEEILFDQACRLEHFRSVDTFRDAYEDSRLTETDGKSGILVVSGLGRNAIVSSLVCRGGEVTTTKVSWSRDGLPEDLVERSVGLAIDPDNGLGNFNRDMATPRMAVLVEE